MHTTAATTIFHYRLKKILPAPRQIALNISTGTLSLLEKRQIVMQYMLPPCETRMLYTLLENYPRYCETEKLFASYRYLLPLTNQSIDECRQLLHNHPRKKLLQAMYNKIANIRTIVQTMDIDIATLLHNGYSLDRYRSQEHVA